MKAIWWLLVASFFYFTSCQKDYVENRFRDLDEARRAGVVDQGWIPGFVPKGATNIIEEHAVEISAARVEFSFPESEDGFVKEFQPAKSQDIATILRGFVPKWGEMSSHGGLEIFIGRDEMGRDSFLVVDRKLKRAQWWNRNRE